MSDTSSPTQPEAAITIDERPLNRRPIFWFYGSASMAYGIKNNAFSYVLLYYATQVLGLAGTTAAFALAIAMLWDAASDLLLGHWSDKTRSRLGRRHPFMYVALIVLPLSFYALFNPLIELTDDNRFYYLLVMALLIRTGTTLFEVPSTALLPDLEADYDRRSRWLALRHSFGWWGGNGIHTINFFFWVGAYGFAVQTGYSIYGTVGALVIFVTILMSALGTQKHAAALPQPNEPFRLDRIGYELRQIFESLRNPNFAALFFYGLAIGMATGLGTALYLYNTTFFFGFSGYQIAWTGVFVMLAPFIASVIVPRVGARFGKKPVAIGAIVCNISLYPLPYFFVLQGWWPELNSTASWAAYSFFIVTEVVCAIIGNVMLDSMMADVVEDSEVNTTRRSEGLFYAARTFALKAVSAGGIIFAGTIVAFVGLENIKSPDQVTWQIRFDLASLFLPVYCGLYLTGLAIVGWLYKIKRSDHSANLEKLAARQVPVSDQ